MTVARRPNLLTSYRAAGAALDPPLTDVVVAVSGGADSVALLRATIELGAGRIVVAHLNHGLRGSDSDTDQDFVERIADSLGVPVRTARTTILPGENLEAAARMARYEWLATVATSEGIGRVATGHSADDQAETVLFRLLRGSGLAGLCGIAPRRLLSAGVELIRPLLTVSRADILDYLTERGQDYRTDATNADTRLARNRIRHELLPLLTRNYNPRIAESLARLAEQARDWQRMEDDALDELLLRCERPRAGKLRVFDRIALASVSRARLRSLWRHVWQVADWPRDGMGFHQYDAVAGLCCGDATALDLPGAIRVRSMATVLQAGPIRAFEEPA